MAPRMLYIFVLFMFAGPGEVWPVTLKANMCERCDSHNSSYADTCSQLNKDFVMCTDENKNCITSYTATPTGLRISKGCATNATCINKWWLTTSQNDLCKEENLIGSGGLNLPIGTTCSFCCQAIDLSHLRCNSHAFPSPETLVSFPNIVAPGDSSRQPTSEISTAQAPLQVTSITTSYFQTSVSSVPPRTASPSLEMTTNGQHYIMKATMCEVCDSHNSSYPDNCTQHDKKFAICRDEYNHCFTKYMMTQGGLRITKGCSTQTTCIDDWWLDTSQNNLCKKENFVGNGRITLPLGVSCSFCCQTNVVHNAYCNKDILPAPETLMSYPHITIPATPSPAVQSASTSYTQMSSTVQLHTASSSLETTTKGLSTQPQKATVLISTPPGQYYEMKATMCEVCDSHNSSYPDNCTQHDKKFAICRDEYNHCFTKYTMTQGGLRITKGCTTRPACINDWWLDTSQNNLCKRENLVGNGGITLPLGTSCSFCCQANVAHNAYCNKDILPAPEMLMSYPHIAIPGTSLPPVQSISTSYTEYSTEQMTTGTMGISTTKADSTSQSKTSSHLMYSSDVYAATSENTSTWTKDIMGISSSPLSSITDGTSQSGISSRPSFADADATTAFTSNNTSAEIIGTTMQMFTGDVKSMRCSLCSLTTNSSSCENQPTICSGEAQFCMTSFYYNGRGDHLIEKRCSSVQDCQTSWWDSTRWKSDCMSDNIDPFTWNGTTPKECDYCCQTMGNSPDDWCNKAVQPTKPKDLLNMTQHETLLTITSAPGNHTSSPTETIMSSPPSSTIDAQTIVDTSTTTIVPTSAVSRQCVQCGDYAAGQPCGALEIILGKPTTCPRGQPYCMNDIIHERTTGTRTVFKRCVDFTDCRERWFEQSSDKSSCTNYDPSKGVTSDLTCHFCCTTDGCNRPYKPADSTLWHL